jgi:predicted esterase
MPISPSVLKKVVRFASFSLILARSIAMQASRGDGMGGKGIVLLPKAGTYSKVVFWFHGLGDTADGWAGLMPELKVDDCKFILPTAPERPISINGGYAMPGWSDIFGLDMEAKEDAVGFGESAERVNALIKMELDKGIPSNKIVLG